MVVRIVLLICVLSSIGLIYYSKVVLADFVILSNPEGPDTSDFFLKEDEL